jgi:hypothetical protein
LGKAGDKQLVLNCWGEFGGVRIQARITNGFRERVPDKLIPTNRVDSLPLKLLDLGKGHVAQARIPIRGISGCASVDGIVLLSPSFRITNKVHEWTKGLDFPGVVWICRTRNSTWLLTATAELFLSCSSSIDFPKCSGFSPGRNVGVINDGSSARGQATPFS